MWSLDRVYQNYYLESKGVTVTDVWGSIVKNVGKLRITCILHRYILKYKNFTQYRLIIRLSHL